MTRADIITEGREWLGTPWQHQASCKGAGADCIGYVAGVAAVSGSAEGARFLATPAWRSYGREPAPTFMFSVADDLMDRIAIATATFADVLIFALGKHPLHFGIMADKGMLLHSWLGARRVCEHQLDAKWRSRIVRAYRIRGIE